MCIDSLTKLGFSEKEAQVYLMLLRIGTSPVSVLAQRVNLKRATVYAILDALRLKGLVLPMETDQGRRYVPQSPDCLLENLELERYALQQKMDAAEACLQVLHQSGLSAALNEENSRVRFHQGFKSVLRAMLPVFEAEKPLFGVLSYLDSSEAERILEQLKEQRERKERTTFLKRVEVNLFCSGSLLVQEDTVAFLTTRETLELMIIEDPYYSRYVREVLVSPYFEKRSVGATISKRSPVKG